MKRLVWIPVLILTGWAVPTPAADAGGYRGPNDAGIYNASGLLKRWPKEGPPLLWQQRVGEAYTGAAVSGDRVYIAGGPFTHLYEFSLYGESLADIPVGNASWKRFSGTRSLALVFGGVVVTTSPNGDLYGVDVVKARGPLETQRLAGFRVRYRQHGVGVPRDADQTCEHVHRQLMQSRCRQSSVRGD